jgi:hypothetical protein
MKCFNGRFVSILIILVLVSAVWAVTKETNENVNSNKENKSVVSNTQKFEMNKNAIKNNMKLYQNLSEDKKVAIKDRMTKLSQKRQNNIKEVEKQIKEYKFKQQLQKANSQVPQIDQLQAIQKIALKENATETAKSLEILISCYQNKQKIRLADDNRLKVE